MLTESIYYVSNVALFKQKALQWASLHNTACYLDSNLYSDPYSAFDVAVAVEAEDEITASAGNAFHALQEFLNKHRTWAFGFFTYDLKNEVEELTSTNADYLYFPDLYFFVPKHFVRIKGNEIRIASENPNDVFEQINSATIAQAKVEFDKKIIPRLSRESYLHTVAKLKQHINRGDIYEVNFCQEFYAEDVKINPIAAFSALNRVSPTPFANFFKLHGKYIISATPERFLCKRGGKLISQPIKGTAKRSQDKNEDESLKLSLQRNAKERAENVMIVDLVRNDLTKSAVAGSVKVEELFGIYSFRQVHHMISTVGCEADPDLTTTDLIKNTYPMGSMTGAPKIKAMQLIDKYERSKRGIFSGSVGYFTPGGDFDFNVIIRTLLYNESSRYLSFQTGSAITSDSEAEKEYEECLLKAAAILEILSR